MKYCKKCLQPDTRPGIQFNEDGVCLACVYSDSMSEIDWEKREAEIQEIASWAKSKKAPYDCVIGVSGGKDSTYQAFYARDVLGLRPLLVNSVPEGITEVGEANIENLINHGFDCIKMRANPRVMKKLIKDAFYKYGNPVKPTEYSLWSSAYIIALKFDIPLIVQGENAALTLGVTKTGQSTDGDAMNTTDQNTLKGCKAKDLVMDGVDFEELYMFDFPSKDEIKEKGIKAVYVQYYSKEWSQIKNAFFSIARGLKQREK